MSLNVSGLAVASRYPMNEIEFTMYTVHGPLNDGEKLARKGKAYFSPFLDVCIFK